MEEFDFMEEPTSQDKKQKVILVSLIVATVSLAGGLVYLLNTNKEKAEIIKIKDQAAEQELIERKKELAASMQDLLDYQSAYSALSTQYDTLGMQLDSSRAQVQSLMDKLQHERQVTSATIRQYQKELGTYRDLIKGYIVQLDSLKTLNDKLTADAAAARAEAKASKKQTEELTKTVATLTNKVSEGAVLKAYGLSAQAIVASGKETDRSSRTADIVTSLTLGANDLAEKGTVVVYIRVKDKDGVLIVGETQKVFEYNGEMMTASASREIDYQGDAVNLRVYLGPKEGTKFEKGTYTIEAYIENLLLDKTDLRLR